MGTGIAGLDRDPRYKIDEFIAEIAGRRDQALCDMTDELKGLVLGLVDQFVMMKKEKPHLDLKQVKFARVRWISREGVLIIDVFHNGRRMQPRDVQGW